MDVWILPIKIPSRISLKIRTRAQDEALMSGRIDLVFAPEGGNMCIRMFELSLVVVVVLEWGWRWTLVSPRCAYNL